MIIAKNSARLFVPTRPSGHANYYSTTAFPSSTLKITIPAPECPGFPSAHPSVCTTHPYYCKSTSALNVNPLSSSLHGIYSNRLPNTFCHSPSLQILRLTVRSYASHSGFPPQTFPSNSYTSQSLPSKSGSVSATALIIS